MELITNDTNDNYSTFYLVPVNESNSYSNQQVRISIIILPHHKLGCQLQLHYQQCILVFAHGLHLPQCAWESTDR